MQMLRRTRLAVAILAVGGLGVGSVAKADPFVGRLIGSVAAGMLVNGAIKTHDKKFAAQCRLYDREGMAVYLPCDSRRPLGEVMLNQRPDAMSDGLAGGPPSAIDVAPLADPHNGRAYAAAPPIHAPPVQYAPPIEDRCDCRPEVYEGRGVHEGYEVSRSRSAIRYSESYGYGDFGYGGAYGYGFTGGVGASSGFYPYGGVGYESGGYGGYYEDGRARAAGRDRNGFLIWAGKPVR